MFAVLLLVPLVVAAAIYTVVTHGQDLKDLRSILAVRGLERTSPAFRKRLLDLAERLKIPVDSLAAIISHESGFKADAANPLPASGLIQLTQGAKLPGFKTKEAIEAIRKLSAVDQIPIIEAFYTRHGKRAQGASPERLFMLNFLPADADKPADFKLGDGDPQADKWRQAVYKSNPGFDREKKGYFTRADVDRAIQGVVASAKGRRMRVDGSLVEGAVPSLPPAPAPGPGPTPTKPPTIAVGERTISRPDAVIWRDIELPGFPGLQVSQPLTWGGIWRSVTMNDLGILADSLGGAPLTKRLADEVWKQSIQFVPPLMDASKETDHEQASKALTDAIKVRLASPEFQAKMASEKSRLQAQYPGLTQAYVDVGLKDWVLNDLSSPAKATNYGLRKPDGGVIQSLGHAHDWQHRDWSQTARLWRIAGGDRATMAAAALQLGATPWAAEQIANGWATGAIA